MYIHFISDLYISFTIDLVLSYLCIKNVFIFSPIYSRNAAPYNNSMHYYTGSPEIHTQNQMWSNTGEFPLFMFKHFDAFFY